MPVYTLTRRGGRTKRDPLFSLRAVRGLYVQAGSLQMTEDEMAGWHHLLDGHGFAWTPRVGDGRGGLACWDSWGRKGSDTTELNIIHQ